MKHRFQNFNVPTIMPENQYFIVIIMLFLTRPIEMLSRFDQSPKGSFKKKTEPVSPFQPKALYGGWVRMGKDAENGEKVKEFSDGLTLPRIGTLPRTRCHQPWNGAGGLSLSGRTSSVISEGAKGEKGRVVVVEGCKLFTFSTNILTNSFDTINIFNEGRIQGGKFQSKTNRLISILFPPYLVHTEDRLGLLSVLLFEVGKTEEGKYWNTFDQLSSCSSTSETGESACESRRTVCSIVNIAQVKRNACSDVCDMYPCREWMEKISQITLFQDWLNVFDSIVTYESSSSPISRNPAPSPPRTRTCPHQASSSGFYFPCCNFIISRELTEHWAVILPDFSHASFSYVSCWHEVRKTNIEPPRPGRLSVHVSQVRFVLRVVRSLAVDVIAIVVYIKTIIDFIGVANSQTGGRELTRSKSRYWFHDVSVAKQAHSWVFFEYLINKWEIEPGRLLFMSPPICECIASESENFHFLIATNIRLNTISSWFEL